MSKKSEPKTAAEARMRMIDRMNRVDSAAMVPPGVNLGTDTQYFLSHEKEKGLYALCENAEAKKALSTAAFQVWEVFGEYIAKVNVTGLFLYDMREQEGIYSTSDGVAVKYPTRGGGTGYKIGIALQAVNDSEDYLLRILIHEVAHILSFTQFGHEAYWYGFLDWMLAEFNAKTGHELVNDYVDFNAEGGRREPPGHPWLNG